VGGREEGKEGGRDRGRKEGLVSVANLANFAPAFAWPASDPFLIPGRLPASRRPFLPSHQALFTGTIAENIRYGRPNATDAEVKQAATDANAHDFITGEEGWEEGGDGGKEGGREGGRTRPSASRKRRGFQRDMQTERRTSGMLPTRTFR
jgi:hypothetical protein